MFFVIYKHWYECVDGMSLAWSATKCCRGWLFRERLQRAWFRALGFVALLGTGHFYNCLFWPLDEAAGPSWALHLTCVPGWLRHSSMQGYLVALIGRLVGFDPGQSATCGAQTVRRLGNPLLTRVLLALGSQAPALIDLDSGVGCKSLSATFMKLVWPSAACRVHVRTIVGYFRMGGIWSSQGSWFE